MAKFLTALGAQAEIENIISNANNSVTMISPFVKIPESLLQSLKDAGRRKRNITFVYGKGQLKPEVRSQLGQLENLSLRFLENLHAKCFYNEESMVITSLNLYESSQGDNREMGVLISRKDDEGCFKDAMKEANLIVGLSTIDDLRKSRIHERSQEAYSPQAGTEGYCIRCRAAIPPDLTKPLCGDCYRTWAKYEYPDYEEKYCHLCGKPEVTTIDKPLCYSCYKRLNG